MFKSITKPTTIIWGLLLFSLLLVGCAKQPLERAKQTINDLYQLDPNTSVEQLHKLGFMDLNSLDEAELQKVSTFYQQVKD